MRPPGTNIPNSGGQVDFWPTLCPPNIVLTMAMSWGRTLEGVSPQSRQSSAKGVRDGLRVQRASRDRLSTKTDVLLADEAPIFEMEELRGLIAEGQEKGLLTFEQIATCLEEVEVTKEQVGELHAYLPDQGIDVIGADGRAATSESGRVEEQAEARATAAATGAAVAPKKPTTDLRVAPTLAPH